MKGWWFRTRAKQILAEKYPDAKFAFSPAWFTAFKKRTQISLRRGTNTCQREPAGKKEAIQQFHRLIRRKAKDGDQAGPLGKWNPRTIANMDQTPLPFSFTQGSTYADRGEKSVWIRGGASGLDKRQCTVQLTLFADGEPRVKPLIIFRGKGKRIAVAERASYDSRVIVQFQANAWSDEDIMKFWVRHCWKSSCDGPMHLILDVHSAQKSNAIQTILEKECNTEVTFVPGGCTSLVQPIDVAFNKPFKSVVDRLATAHMQENLDAYVTGGMTASRRRVLITRWVGQAWEEVCTNKDMIIRSFLKCGISVAVDGSQDSQINISGLDGYEVGESDSEPEDKDEDPFADVENDSNEEGTQETEEEEEDTEEEEEDTQEEEEDTEEEQEDMPVENAQKEEEEDAQEELDDVEGVQEEGDKGNTPEVEDAQEKENDTDDSKEDTEGAVRGHARGRRGRTGGRGHTGGRGRARGRRGHTRGRRYSTGGRRY